MTTESFNKLRMTTESFNKFHRTNLLTPGSNISRVRLMSKNVNRNENDGIGQLDEHYMVIDNKEDLEKNLKKYKSQMTKDNENENENDKSSSLFTNKNDDDENQDKAKSEYYKTLRDTKQFVKTLKNELTQDDEEETRAN